ncbi:MAG: hypothetical protein HRT74_04540 [Flavobacteriales bacterium]|nr:hypothetical protein [Flavobacteriales bacterium]
MSKILIICPYPIGFAPSQRYRFEIFLEELQRNHEVEVAPFFSEKTWQILYQRGKWGRKLMGMFMGFVRRALLILKIGRYNHVLVHREESPFGFPVVSFAIAKVYKKKLIFDFDDAVWLPNVSKGNRLFRWMKGHHNVIRLMKWSTTCVGGNSYLCNFAKKYCDDVIQIPSVVSMENRHRDSKKEKSNQPLNICWTGSHSTIQYLELIVNQMKSWSSMGHQIYIISDQDPNFEDFPYHWVEWSNSIEISSLQNMDVGIMPLPDEEWVKGKCGFKLIQYMSMGVIPVASPVGVNTSLLADDRGLLLGDLDEWEHLPKRIRDLGDLDQISNEGQMFIKAQYSKQSQLDNFLHLFTVK